VSRHHMFSAMFIVAATLVASTAWSNSATLVFERVSPSVVVVFAHDQAGKAISQGSGVVVEPEVVVTNCHVLEKGVTYAIAHQGRRHPARLRHANWERDVCSLSVPALAAPAVALGSTHNLKVGQQVYAVGAPRGLELTLSEGIISSLRDIGVGSPYLQITAPISPGSSGGGLFDEEGQLIGLPTLYLAEGQQLNFALPVEFVQQLLQQDAASTASRPHGAPSADWLHRALALEERKDWSALRQHARAWARAQPNNVIAWFSLGVAYDEQGQTANAIEGYQQALRIDPQYAAAWVNLGNAYSEQGQTAQAIEAFRQALRIDPQYAAAWFNLGNAYGDQGQTAKAIEAYQQALRIDPQKVAAWVNLGNAYSEQGQTAQAIEAFRQALRIDPQHADAWVNLGVVYGEQGQAASAIKAYQQALRIDPRHAMAWYNLGVAYDQQGQTAKAIEAYQQALRIDPRHAMAWYNLGVAYDQQGQTAKAIEAYQQALRIDPQYAAAWNNLGVAYAIQGNRTKVIEVYQVLKGLDPELADRLFRLAILP